MSYPRRTLCLRRVMSGVWHGAIHWIHRLATTALGSGLPRWISGETSSCNAEDTGDRGSVSGSGRSPGGGHGNPLQYCCLENPMERGAWRAMVHRVLKSQTWLKLLSRHTPWDPPARWVWVGSQKNKWRFHVFGSVTMCSTLYQMTECILFHPHSLFLWVPQPTVLFVKPLAVEKDLEVSVFQGIEGWYWAYTISHRWGSGDHTP